MTLDDKKSSSTPASKLADSDEDDDDDEEACDMEAFEESGMLEADDGVRWMHKNGGEGDYLALKIALNTPLLYI